ncbi:MAG: hypothetical protein A2X49_13510 [Lentisphaerae bacterium GWF2_52_8]|nr:MAG: hypothetical protein A2X49_13510 [Lentisphaerae bacterium GWF2_52_8]
MNKSLTPLIICLAMVVLLTVVIIHFQHQEKPVFYDKAQPQSSMELKRPSPQIRFQPRKTSQQDSQSTERSQQETSMPDISKLLKEAEWFLNSGEPKQAEENLRTILVFAPNNFDALALFGNILYHSGRYAEAETVFRKQLSLNPDSPSVYNNLGSALAKQKKFGEAVSSTEKGIALNPDSMPSAFLNLSGMYAAAGEPDSAIFWLKKAYEKIGPSIAPLCFDPTLDSIRQNPEFQALISKIEKGEPLSKTLSTPPQSLSSPPFHALEQAEPSRQAANDSDKGTE